MKKNLVLLACGAALLAAVSVSAAEFDPILDADLLAVTSAPGTSTYVVSRADDPVLDADLFALGRDVGGAGLVADPGPDPVLDAALIASRPAAMADAAVAQAACCAAGKHDMAACTGR